MTTARRNRSRGSPVAKARPKKGAVEVGDLVIIEWRDAIADVNWVARESVSELKPIIHSIGWVQRCSEESITIAADIGTAGDNESNRRMEVPSGMIQRVMVIHRKDGKAKLSK